MKNLVNLWQWHKTENFSMLNKVISCGPPQKLYGVNTQLQYFFSFNGEEPQHFFTFISQAETITHDFREVAPMLIKLIIEEKLREWPVYPILLPTTPQGKEFLQRFQPSSLLATMWFQVFQAVSGEKRFKRCAVCQKWEDVTVKKETWKSHPECSSRERVRRYRDKKELTQKTD